MSMINVKRVKVKRYLYTDSVQALVTTSCFLNANIIERIEPVTLFWDGSQQTGSVITLTNENTVYVFQTVQELIDLINKSNIK